MSPERQQQIEELTTQALQQPITQRHTWLTQQCADDQELRNEVESHLIAQTAVTGAPFTQEVSVSFAPDTGKLPAIATPAVETVGNYKLLRKLGQGGMGTVYLAERHDGLFQQRVALKLIRQGMDADDIVRRFKSERQILASLEHPNIARLLDGGTTTTGLPYFVMEYIEGMPLDEYCKQHSLSLDNRLNLFRQVCEAVHYAHQHLVIHRDLKPSNIIVTAAGVPKLLDFGIAKVLNPDRFDITAVETHTHGTPMTPAYASPEQVRGQSISTASDVYSLGVLLYELLTGQRPYEIKVSSAPWEIARIICEAEPQRPSTAVNQSSQTAQAAARLQTQAPAARGKEPTLSNESARISRQLKGDLDNIVLMALRKEPQRRYASVEQFSEDLRRYLAGLPVMARPLTFGYRSRKFMGRNKIGVAAAAIVLLTLVIGMVTALWQARLARVERDRAAKATDFLARIFDGVDPDDAAAKPITPLELLNKAESRLRDELKDQPALQAQLLCKIGEVFGHLGQYDRAQKLLEESLQTRRALLGAQHQEVAESLRELGFVHWLKGEYTVAEPLYREALGITQKFYGKKHEATLDILNNLAVLLRDNGDLATAESLTREVLALRRETHGSNHPNVANSLNNLAASLQDKGDYAGASASYNEALKILRQVFGNQHLQVAHTLRNLATVQSVTANYDEAEKNLNEALLITRAALGTEHPSLALIVTDIGRLRRRQGNYEGALGPLQEALMLRRRVRGNAHLDVADSLNELGVLLSDKGDYVGAEKLYSEALLIRRQNLGNNHRLVALLLGNLAVAVQAKGDYVAALPLYEEALQIRRQLLGPEHPEVAGTLANLGMLHFLTQEYASAEKLFRESLQQRQKLLPADHPDIIHSKIGLGRTLTGKGDAAQAEPLLREALAYRQQKLPAGHLLLGDAAGALGDCLTALQQFDGAEPLLLQCYEINQSKRGAKHRTTQRSLTSLVKLYQVWGKPARAAEYQKLLSVSKG